MTAYSTKREAEDHMLKAIRLGLDEAECQYNRHGFSKYVLKDSKIARFYLDGRGEWSKSSAWFDQYIWMDELLHRRNKRQTELSL